MPVYSQNGNGELPADVKAMLADWPASGSGSRAVHRHILSLANRLRHHVEFDQACGLIRDSMPRRPKPGEIEQTLAKAYDVTGSQKAAMDAVPTHLPDLQLIERIVAERIGPKPALRELEERSAPVPGSTGEILAALFPADCLICAGKRVDDGCTVPLAKLDKPERFCFVVPNPMTAPYAIDRGGRKHWRSLANTGPRRFIVADVDIKPVDRNGHPTIYAPLIDKWKKHGVTVQDAAAGLFRYLGEHGPLVMVVYSGNVSLQGWFFCLGEDESETSNLRSFFQSAVILGCDRAGWIKCQFFRMPGATRPETGHRQTVHYFNPSVIETDENDDDAK